MNSTLRLVLLPLLALCGTILPAQQPATVVMLSDLHFDPLHDPAKAQQLAAAPVEGWDAILFAPDSPTQAADFAGLQSACKAKGIDSPAALIQSSLATAAAQSNTQSKAQPVAFVTVTGDLIVHGIDCRYARLIQPNDPAGYAAFTAKISRYVLQHIESAFPKVPVYYAGGNNDSSCGDYRMDPANDSYFSATAPEIQVGLRTSPAAKPLADYRANGSYTVLVPGLKNTRLIALDDIFFSSEYKTCSGKSSPQGEDAALLWLNQQLTLAEQAHEHVWVIAHIPPGINAYSTLSKRGNLCDGTAPKLFLADDRLAETLESHASVISLALFGHTHSDEMRLFAGKIPAKLVGSVTPQHGNLPTVTLAQVSPTNARLLDYTVYQASNFTGVDTTWSRLYNFHETYAEPDFSAASISNLLTAFATDTASNDPRSRAYQNFFTPGMLPVLGLVWHPYTCALATTTPEAYRTCACPTNPTAK